MADYFNLRKNDWVLLHEKKSYRITVGVNKQLPGGLEKRFPGMLAVVQPKTPVVKPPAPTPVEKPKSEVVVTAEKVKSISEEVGGREPEKTDKDFAVEKLEDERKLKLESIAKDTTISTRQKTWKVKAVDKWFLEEKAKL